MAGDLQLTILMQQKVKCKTKIFKVPAHELHIPEPFIIGFAGNMDEAMPIVDWLHYPEIYGRAPRVRNTIGLILTESGHIYTFVDPTKMVEIR